MSETTPLINQRSRRSVRLVIQAVLLAALIVAMVLSTKAVKIGTPTESAAKTFDPAAYGEMQFPKTKAAIMSRAVSADTLATALAKDADAAGKQYGVAGGGIGPEISVKFTGVAGDVDSGIYTIKVPNVPDSVIIRVQTGPAINGTDLRDATGTIGFEQFVNQIDYQNAGYAINSAMKKAVLEKIDTDKLKGKTISVVGVLQLINPTGWLVTPVQLDVQ